MGLIFKKACIGLQPFLLDSLFVYNGICFIMYVCLLLLPLSHVADKKKSKGIAAVVFWVWLRSYLFVYFVRVGDS